MSPIQALAVAFLAFAAQSPVEGNAFVRALRDLPADLRPKAADQRAAELASQPGAVAAWLEVRSADALPNGGEEIQPLSAAQIDLLSRAAKRLPRQEVLTVVADQVGSTVDPAWRQAAFELLGWHGSSAEVPLLVELARDPQGELQASGPLADAFQRTLTDITKRDARACAKLGWLAENAKPLLPTAVHAIGKAGDPEALPYLTKLLGNAELFRVAMQEIARLADRAPIGQRPGLADRLRPFLTGSDAATRDHAARALVALRDEKSLPEFLKLAASEDTRARRTAFSALREITGRNFPDDVDRWRQWLEEEQRWLESEAPAALAKLSSAQDADVVAAIRTISERSLDRDRLAEGIVQVLRTHASAAVRGQCCIALERLRSRVGLEALVQALSDSDPAVGGHALSALRAITGLSLPWDAPAWNRALFSGT